MMPFIFAFQIIWIAVAFWALRSRLITDLDCVMLLLFGVILSAVLAVGLAVCGVVGCGVGFLLGAP